MFSLRGTLCLYLHQNCVKKQCNNGRMESRRKKEFLILRFSSNSRLQYERPQIADLKVLSIVSLYKSILLQNRAFWSRTRIKGSKLAFVFFQFVVILDICTFWLHHIFNFVFISEGRVFSQNER